MYKFNLTKRRLAALSAVLFFSLSFFYLSSEVQESDAGHPELIGQFDRTLSQISFNFREPHLNAVATDITALGSTTVLILIILSFLTGFLFLEKRRIVAQVIVLALGAAALTLVFKNIFERVRPPLSGRLVEASGFSYPSGHSLASTAVYFGLAFILSSFVKALWQKTIILSGFSFLAFAIGFSRIYLGVHFASDVLAGVLLGAAWAILVHFIFEHENL